MKPVKVQISLATVGKRVDLNGSRFKKGKDGGLHL